MQRRRQGFATTFLMLIPMLGVPAMAIFGIPQFAPLVSSMASHADEPEIPGFHETRIGQSETGSLRTRDVPPTEPVDLFRPYSSEPPAVLQDGSAPRPDVVQWSDPLRSPSSPSTVRATQPMPTSHREASVRSSRQMHQQVYDIFADDFRHQPQPAAIAAQPVVATAGAQARTASLSLSEAAAARPTDGQLTWREAIDRLKACGSTSYRLTAGARDGEYLFVCLVSSPDDERITRRFEAESPDPLNAVENVLGQIGGWRRR